MTEDAASTGLATESDAATPAVVAPAPRAAADVGTTLPAAPALGIAAVGGGLLAGQSRLNAKLGHDLGQPVLAAVVSNSIGLTIGLIATACSRQVRAGVGRVRGSGLRWWECSGGLCGACIVAGGIFVVPHLGVALFTVGQVAGQTSGGLACDRVGLAPGGRRPVTVPRVVGAALAILAVALSDLLGGSAHVSVPFLLLAAAIGVAGAVQGALNGRLRQVTVDPLATVTVNGVVGTAGLLVVLGILAAATGLPIHHWPTAPWEYLGGPMGVCIVFAMVFTVRALGVLRLALTTIAGQLVTAVVLDQLTPAHAGGITVGTVLGVLLTFVAVAVAGVSAPVVRRRRGGGESAA